MGDFLKAAYQVLSERGKPLSAREIVQIAREQRQLETGGSTPWQTMKSKLSTDILKNSTKSLFMRSAAGRFALREWESQLKEHVAPRYTKALFDEDILVFPASSLRTYVKRIGLNLGNADSQSIFGECYPMRRRQAEEDQTVVQLVSFYVVRYKNEYLTYKRTKRLPESRLHGYYSIGFGGHLNEDDFAPLFNNTDPDQVFGYIIRELREELRVKPDPVVSFRGLLYDDSREVSRQHLGIVYDVRLHSRDYEIGERGFLMDPKFETIDEIMRRSDDFENWSVLIAKEELCRTNESY